jgi:hypothetical protein
MSISINKPVRKFAVAITIMLAAVAYAGAQNPASSAKSYVGFDRNEYPGDDALPALRKHFSYTGYWLTNPPGAHRNGWLGKRQTLLRQGFGFLVLANGKFDKEILSSSLKPDALGKKDAAIATTAATREGFPPKTILFLDQEEGGRMLPEQMAYLLAWSEAVAGAGFRPGIYASGQPVREGPGVTITTAQDIRARVAAQHLHEIAMWVYEDDCPPAPGCTLQSPPLSSSGTPDAIVWQYAQSPRRPKNTASCAKTYAADGNCYAADLNHLLLDLNVSNSSDPSAGR